jgi:anti-sigma factor RsiW
MKCDTGLLHAYVDDALPPAQRDVVAGHLVTCASCRAELAALRARSMAIEGRLAALEPVSYPSADPARALARFRAETLPERPTLWMSIKRSFDMTKNTLWSGKWRPLTIGAAALVCVAILLSFAPVRQAAADFLGVFRVRKFAVIPVDPSKAQQLEELAKLADQGQFGKPTFTREPDAGQQAADAAEAAALAGFAVRVPASLPAGVLGPEVRVTDGPAIHYEMDRAAMQALLDAAGIQDVTLPDVDNVTINVDVPKMVSMKYTSGRGDLTLIQLPSPQVDMPAGLDPVTLGEAAFKWLGMADDDARRLAQTIDWTSTVLIPLPTDVAQAREVTVDGVTGLLLEDNNRARGDSLLMWQRGDMVYGVDGKGVNSDLLLQLADSLQ